MTFTLVAWGNFHKEDVRHLLPFKSLGQLTLSKTIIVVHSLPKPRVTVKQKNLKNLFFVAGIWLNLTVYFNYVDTHHISCFISVVLQTKVISFGLCIAGD